MPRNQLLDPYVLCVICTRMASRRLPHKVASDIQGKPMLQHIIDRVRACRYVDDIAIATTIDPEDKWLVELAKKNDLFCFRGARLDVLDRFYNCAMEYEKQHHKRPDVLVRITHDDPFKDPQIVDLVVRKLIDSHADYASNWLVPTYPLGLDAEAFTLETLEWAYLNAFGDFEKEHVTPYIYNNKETFRCVGLASTGDLHQHRWTVDYPGDLDWTRKIYAKLYPQNPLFGMKEMLALFEREPGLIRTDKDLFLEG